MRALAGVQLQLLMFDRRIEYSATKGTPCGSTYVCRGILPRPLVIEHLERCGKPSAMYDADGWRPGATTTNSNTNNNTDENTRMNGRLPAVRRTSGGSLQ